LAPAAVFNLVESLAGSDRLQTIVPLLLEEWNIPFTGNGSAAMLLSNDKIASKRRLAEFGLPVPACVWIDARGRTRVLPEDLNADARGDWILKAAESHASLFLDDSSILRNATGDEAARRVEAASRERGQPFFAERFIDGREFNLSILEGADGLPATLPAAEINFAALPPGRPRLVGYSAKWDANSAEYHATPRTFDLRDGDQPLVEELRRLSLAVWRAMGLSGYARVDFRVDAAGRPFILEANANPCLSPDAGFAAAAARGGLEYAAMIGKILQTAVGVTSPE
ncbi:MAG: D-alanine--D-alanine ligase, partial [Planctomycetota bacterium]|nr:D-alanine--D-alanine ligase [Planctomycetota bacterium]